MREQCFQVVDEIDFNLQRLESAVNLHFSFQSNKMNEVMKTLTLVAALFIPLTFIAGVYGMNFEHMPELKNPYAYPIVWGVMLSVSFFMLWYFKRKKWF